MDMTRYAIERYESHKEDDEVIIDEMSQWRKQLYRHNAGHKTSIALFLDKMSKRIQRTIVRINLCSSSNHIHRIRGNGCETTSCAATQGLCQDYTVDSIVWFSSDNLVLDEKKKKWVVRSTHEERTLFVQGLHIFKRN